MLADALNEHCLCISSDRANIASQLKQAGASAANEDVDALFSHYPVFVGQESVDQMNQLVAATHQVLRTPRFVELALSHAPAIARLDQGTRGLLHGFDFHISPEGPRLIEINTNAGGVLLSSMLAQAQQPCCDAVSAFLDEQQLNRTVAEAVLAGFVEEFQLARGPAAVLRTVAIVDERPESQFLYSEFVLFAELFRKHGINAHIADPSELRFAEGKLYLREQVIDLVYNRLTDFYLESEALSDLRAAYVANAVVLTPHPRAHALLANKQHLALFTDAEQLRELGVDAAAIETLTRLVPRAEVVKPEHRERLYRERKGLFFKPLRGYASKGAYRGDKLTRTKFEEIMGSDYLAQSIVPPSERTLKHAGEVCKLKLDVRAYVVSERSVHLAARLYQGQTTNFRTPGGGFATVLATP